MTERVVASFHITAYNCEKYIGETLDSLINQTEPRWILVICDNGSTDGTGKIIKEYAKKDNRIFSWRIEKNRDFKSEKFFRDRDRATEWVQSHNPEFFAILDADDYYHQDFLKKSYERALETGADMVVSGTVMFQDIDNSISMIRIPPEIGLVKNKLKTEEFIKLYGSLRTVWGKLISNKYSAYFHRECVADLPECIQSGEDTYRILKLLDKIEGFSSIGETLHFYRIRRGSDSRGKVIPQSRIEEGVELNKLASAIAEKYDVKNRETETFLSEVLLNHIKDAVNLVRISEKMSFEDKILYLNTVLQNREFVANMKKTELLNEMVNFIYRTAGDICHEESGKKIEIKHLVENLNGACFDATGTSLLENCLNTEELDLHRMFKGDFLELIDKGDFEWADTLSEQILKDRPLDTEAMYFKLYITYLRGDKQYREIFLRNAVFKGCDELNSELRENILQDIENIRS